MSVVLCVIDRACDLYLAADKRAVTNGVKHDDLEKIRRIRPHLYLGMTGTAALGEVMVTEASKHDKLSVSQLIDHLDSVIGPSLPKLTITLAGRDNDGALFVWRKSNSGVVHRPEVLETNVVLSVASTEKSDAIYDRLVAELGRREGVEAAMRRTIEFAASIEDSISSAYDLVRVSASASTPRATLDTRG